MKLQPVFKNLFLCLCLPLLLFSCNSGGSNGDSSSISCADIAGSYSGKFKEKSCNGKSYSGAAYATIGSSCDVSIKARTAANIVGTFTSESGGTYSGRAQSSLCGAISLSCKKKGTSLSCSYTIDSGGNGQIY